MEFAVQKDNLLKALQMAVRAVPNKTTMPVMMNFLIRVNGMDGEVIGNDMAKGITAKFNCMSVQDGEALVDARTLLAAVNKLGKGDINFKLDGTTVIVTSGKARYEFETMPVEQFTQIADISDASEMTISGDVLSDMIDGVVFAVGQNTSQKCCTGVYFRVKNKNLDLVAMDLVRVAVKRYGVDADDVEAIIPGNGMADISRMISGKEVKIEFAKTLVRFSTDEMSMVVRTIALPYMAVDKVLNAQMSIKVSIDRKQLLESIDRALVVKVSDKKPIVLDFNAGKVNLTMQTGTKSFNEDVACETGNNVIKIGVNPQYLLDALKVISDDEIHIEMANSNSPMFLTSENDAYKYVILPISM